MNESVVNFDCHSDRLIGILHQPVKAQKNIGVVVVVGGPQYRVGSHRQFTIMARAFAAAGYPTLRFDYRGMGDSEGEFKGFEYIDDDIKSAIDALVRESPKIDGVVLWGLCDAASACLIYANQKDKRVKGMILANPWVRTVSGEAKAYIKHYYLQRVLQKSFWSKLFSGSFKFKKSIFELLFMAKNSRVHSRGYSLIKNSYIDRMLAGFESRDLMFLFLISDNDLTAKEFIEHTRNCFSWKNAIYFSKESSYVFMKKSDHTFSSRDSLNSMVARCIEWIDRLH